MAQAKWKGTVLAESDKFELVEGNVYFPPDCVNFDYLSLTDTHTTCPWKGLASYYDVIVDGETNKDAAWTYLEPKEKALHITRHVAFGGGIEVER
ncbi:MAG: DUF427 domain-containing protein [Dehalococcoidia bacterium]